MRGPHGRLTCKQQPLHRRAHASAHSCTPLRRFCSGNCVAHCPFCGRRVAIFLACITSTSATSDPPPPPLPSPPPPPCEDSGGLSYCQESVGTIALKIQKCKEEPYASLCQLSCGKCFLSPPSAPSALPPPPLPSPPPPPCEDSGGLSYCQESVGTIALKIQKCKEEPYASLCQLSCGKCFLSPPSAPSALPPPPLPATPPRRRAKTRAA